MGRNSVSYNNLLSLGACGIENDSGTGGFETIHGDHSLLLHGRMYHFLPNNSPTCGLYFFTYDAIQEMQVYGDRTMNQRDNQGEIKHYRFYAKIGAALYHEQTQLNYLVQECVSQGERVRQEVIPVLNLPTTTFDIASIVSDDASRPNRKIFFQLRNDRTTSSINLMSNIMEPLCYPLLFPYGEKGWGADNRKLIKFNDYILPRFLLPERDIDGQLLLMPSQASPQRLIPSENENLEGDANPNDEENNDEVEKTTLLSQSCHDSRRHLLALAQSAICLITEFGSPTLFITFTCNPH